MVDDFDDIPDDELPDDGEGEDQPDKEDDDGAYQVGYRKPPRHSQFKPGQFTGGRTGSDAGFGARLPREKRFQGGGYSAEKCTANKP